MSKEGKEKEEKIVLDYCPHCGAKVDQNKIYCPNCGKLVVKVKPSEGIPPQKPQTKISSTGDISRTCPGCGSIITSRILEQCPICNALLPKLPEELKKPPEPRPGFIFTDKKLEPETKFYLKKDTWNLREGARIVEICISLRILIYLIVAFQLTIFDITATIPMMFLFYIGLLPELLYGIYPLWYISSHKHEFKKLGLINDKKKFLIALVVGILGGIILLLINSLSEPLLDLVNALGWGFADVSELLASQNMIINSAALGWKLLLILLIIATSISSELLFRGVLHNTLKVRFEDSLYGKIIVIVIVAGIYAAVNLLLTFPIGIFFVLLDFIVFLILGVLYEINGNLYNTIIASVFYNILALMLIML